MPGRDGSSRPGICCFWAYNPPAMIHRRFSYVNLISGKQSE